MTIDRDGGYRMILEFDYMNKDVIGAHVRANSETGIVEAEEFTNIQHHQFFAKRPHTIEYMNEVFESRCFPRTQDGAELIVEALGLHQYNPLDIVRLTHGRLYKDYNWIRFKGENLSWADVESFDHIKPATDVEKPLPWENK